LLVFGHFSAYLRRVFKNVINLSGATTMRILLAEDDAILGDGLRAGLRQQGFQVDWVRDGVAAQRELMTGEYAAAVLDLGLPHKDGLDVLQALRDKKIATPILILTARDAVSERIRGLDLGADDYCLKPLDLHELGARVRALVRRAHGQVQDVLQCGTLTIDRGARQASYNGAVVILSTREFDLLYVLMLNVGRVMSRDQLEQQLYSWGYEVESNTIEVHIHHLRKKLNADVIQTVRGVGYTISRDQETPQNSVRVCV
jgi:DNA-binding response OmpR family regulator